MRRFILPDLTVIVLEADAVQDDRPTVVQRIAGHQGFGQLVQSVAVDPQTISDYPSSLNR